MAERLPSQSGSDAGPEPTVAELLNALTPIASKWETLGRKLKLDEGQLQIIAADHPAGDDGATLKRLSAVLRVWGSNADDVSRRVIVRALYDMEERRLATKIRRQLGGSTSRSSTSSSMEVSVEKLTMENRERMKAKFFDLAIDVELDLDDKMSLEMDQQEGGRKFKKFAMKAGAYFNLKVLRHKSSVPEIFEEIQDEGLWDLNGNPFRQLLAITECTEYIDVIEKVRSQVTEYDTQYLVTTKIADYIYFNQDILSPQPTDSAKHKVDFVRLSLSLEGVKVNEKSLNYLAELWKDIKKSVMLPDLYSLLASIEEGSVTVTWLVPFYAVLALSRIPHTAPELLRKYSITRMTIDGVCFYDHEEITEVRVIDRNGQPSLKPKGLAIADDTSQEENVETTSEGQEKGFLSARAAPHEEGPPPKRARLEYSYERATSRRHLLQGFRDKSFDEDEESYLQTVEEEATMVESTLSLEEAAAMKLGDGKSSPHPDSPPETHPCLHPQEAGYDYDLVKEDPDLLCLICRLALRDPVQVSCCGKRFCKACIEQWIKHAKSCPACNVGDFDTFEDKATKQKILEVKVHCSNKIKGCGWKGEACQLEKHLNLDPEKEKMDLGCQYVSIECIHCSEECPRHHMRSCPQQPYSCPYCKHYSSTYENVSKQHLSECNEFPVQCKMCAMKVPRKSIQQHESGCGRKQDTTMAFKHDIVETPSPVFVPPPTFVMNDITAYKEKRESWYSPPFYSHIGGYKLCLSVDAHGLAECSGTHVSLYMHLECGEYDDSLAFPFAADVTVQLVNQRRDKGHMERTICFNEETPAISTSRVTEGKQGAGQGYNNFMPNSALQYDEKWNTEFLSNDSLEFRISGAKLTTTAEGLPTEVLIPPVNITMSNFIARKIRDDSWFSPPFYSHTGGYKMCLSIHANGNKSGAGTHLSLFVRLMRGEHDDNLKWPFTGDITVQLVNQSKNKAEHDVVERTINFTETASADRVTEGERGSGIGLFQFVSHSTLYCDEPNSPSYIKNDCLEFRVVQVKLTN